MNVCLREHSPPSPAHTMSATPGSGMRSMLARVGEGVMGGIFISQVRFHSFRRPVASYHLSFDPCVFIMSQQYYPPAGAGFLTRFFISAMSLMRVSSQVPPLVRVGTTLNHLNRPTRAVVSLAINHSHSPRWSTCRFQSSFPGGGVLTAALACSQQQPQEKESDGTCMACLAGACLCCCCEGELRCSFPFLVMCPYDIRST